MTHSTEVTCNELNKSFQQDLALVTIVILTARMFSSLHLATLGIVSQNAAAPAILDQSCILP